MPLSPVSRAILLDLARSALLETLAAAAATDPSGRLFPASTALQPPPEASPWCDPADPELLRLAGCFVSLHERAAHRLRGCVGRVDARLPLWQVVQQTARDVLNDPRFVDRPVQCHQAALLEIEISILSAPAEAASPLDFDPLTDGIYLTYDGRAGFFLPQVARSTRWTRQQLLDRLCTEKLGLRSSTWQEPQAKLYRFAVEVLGPEGVLKVEC